MLAGRASSRTTCGCVGAQLGGVLDHDDALVRVDQREQRRKQGGLAGAGAAGDQEREPGRHDRAQPGPARRHGARGHQVVEGEARRRGTRSESRCPPARPGRAPRAHGCRREAGVDIGHGVVEPAARRRGRAVARAGVPRLRRRTARHWLDAAPRSIQTASGAVTRTSVTRVAQQRLERPAPGELAVHPRGRRAGRRVASRTPSRAAPRRRRRASATRPPADERARAPGRATVGVEPTGVEPGRAAAPRTPARPRPAEQPRRVAAVERGGRAGSCGELGRERHGEPAATRLRVEPAPGSEPTTARASPARARPRRPPARRPTRARPGSPRRAARRRARAPPRTASSGAGEVERPQVVAGADRVEHRRQASAGSRGCGPACQVPGPTGARAAGRRAAAAASRPVTPPRSDQRAPDVLSPRSEVEPAAQRVEVDEHRSARGDAGQRQRTPRALAPAPPEPPTTPTTAPALRRAPARGEPLDQPGSRRAAATTSRRRSSARVPDRHVARRADDHDTHAAGGAGRATLGGEVGADEHERRARPPAAGLGRASATSAGRARRRRRGGARRRAGLVAAEQERRAACAHARDRPRPRRARARPGPVDDARDGVPGTDVGAARRPHAPTIGA